MTTASPERVTTKQTLSQLIGIDADSSISPYLTPVKAKLLTAITAQDAEGAAAYVVTGISQALQAKGMDVRFNLKRLRDFLNQHQGWEVIHRAINDQGPQGDNARAAVLGFFTTSSGQPMNASIPQQRPVSAPSQGQDGHSRPGNNGTVVPMQRNDQARSSSPQRPAARYTSHDDNASPPKHHSQSQHPERDSSRSPASGFTPKQSQGEDIAKKANGDELHITTCEGEALFPYLDKPDYYKNVDGAYKVKLAFHPADMEHLTSQLMELRDNFFESVKADLIARKKFEAVEKLHLKDIYKPDFNEQGQRTGRMLLNAKSKAIGQHADGSHFERKPRAYDAAANRLDKMPAIFSGSRLCLSCIARPYHKPDNNEVGITFYLEAVQVIKLVTGSSVPAGDGFRSTMR